MPFLQNATSPSFLSSYVIDPALTSSFFNGTHLDYYLSLLGESENFLSIHKTHFFCFISLFFLFFLTRSFWSNYWTMARCHIKALGMSSPYHQFVARIQLPILDSKDGFTSTDMPSFLWHFSVPHLLLFLPYATPPGSGRVRYNGSVLFSFVSDPLSFPIGYRTKFEVKPKSRVNGHPTLDLDRQLATQFVKHYATKNGYSVYEYQTNRPVPGSHTVHSPLDVRTTEYCDSITGKKLVFLRDVLHHDPDIIHYIAEQTDGSSPLHFIILIQSPMFYTIRSLLLTCAPTKVILACANI
jgi:hypothetical protein